MRRIYTRTGDSGTTAIHGGRRVPKSDIRIEANGSVDELNVAVGIVRAHIPSDHPWQIPLRNIQFNLMGIMRGVASPSDCRDESELMDNDAVIEVERLIDRITGDIGPATRFILPGGSRVAAFLHQARVCARRAERRLWSLNDSDPVDSVALKYINRLSDLFFTMARAESIDSEEPWQKFSHYRLSK